MDVSDKNNNLVQKELDKYKFKLVFNRETTIENLLKIKKILDDIECKFYPGFGTFLGMYREKNIIVNDSDSDLIVFEDGYDKILKNLHLFLAADLKILRNNSGSILSFHRNDNYTDIYPFYFRNNIYQNGGYKLDLIHIEKESYLDLFGVKWLVFSEPEKYLEGRYGPDWRIPTPGRCADG